MFIHLALALLIGITYAGRMIPEEESCPLCDYVFRDDGAHSYSLISSYNRSEEGLDVMSYLLNMTSQHWKDETWTDHPIWWHYLAISVPNEIKHPEYGFLVVGHGSNYGSFARPVDFSDNLFNKTAHYANDVGIISAAVYMIPNQVLVYTNDSQSTAQYEDDSIAYTWAEFVEQTNDGSCDRQPETWYENSCADPEVLLLMPMCKGAVKAMDTIDIFARNDLNLEEGVNQFMLTGASKRGWTTWLTGAIDDRVVAMAPVVYPNLNMKLNFHHYYRSFGGWPFYLYPYWKNGIMGQIDEAGSMDLFNILDPYYYLPWMDFPKLLITATSDEFFLLDDTHYFWDDMPDEKYLWLVQDAGHNFWANPTYEQFWMMLQTYFISIITEHQRPYLFWERCAPKERKGVGSITLHSDTIPSQISVFSAMSVVSDRRDWRMNMKCDVGEPCFSKETNITWTKDTNVTDLGDGQYYVEYDVPPEGYLAFFLRVEFPGPEGRSLIFTSEANILPDSFPHPGCTGIECNGVLK